MRRFTDYRESLSTVNTTIFPDCGYLADEHRLRERLGLLTEPVEQVRTRRASSATEMTAHLRRAQPAG